MIEDKSWRNGKVHIKNNFFPFQIISLEAMKETMEELCTELGITPISP